MSFLRVVLFVLVSVLGFSQCAFVDTLKKCGIKDTACHRDLINTVIKGISKTGIPEYSLPPIDPIELKHVNVSIFNVIDLELLEGTATGVKNCVIDSSSVNIEHLHASIQLTCDITIRGKYKLSSSSPITKNIFGGDIHGEGNCEIKIKKVTIKIEFSFEIIKRGGETFFTSDLKKYKYSYHIHGNVHFAADNLYLGDKESSKEIVKLMNENWKSILDASGSHFFDIAMKYIFRFLRLFFDNVATKYYIKDDLASLA